MRGSPVGGVMSAATAAQGMSGTVNCLDSCWASVATAPVPSTWLIRNRLMVVVVVLLVVVDVALDGVLVVVEGEGAAGVVP